MGFLRLTPAWQRILLLVTAGMLSKRPPDSNDPGGIPAKFLGAMQRTQRCVISRRSPCGSNFPGFLRQYWHDVYSDSRFLAGHNADLGTAHALILRDKCAAGSRVLETNIARTFAALNATNEAILYAKSPEELYGQVCEAAFSSGDFLATAVFLLEPDTNLLRFAAGFGEDTARLRSIDISVVAGTPEGSGVCGPAFRDQKLCISNDYLHDAHSMAWRQGAAAGQVGAAAGLPLTRNGRSVGVFLVTRREAGSIDAPMVALLERM